MGCNIMKTKGFFFALIGVAFLVLFCACNTSNREEESNYSENTQQAVSEDATETSENEVVQVSLERSQPVVEMQGEEEASSDAEAVSDSDAFEIEVYEAKLCANKTVNVRKGPSTGYDKVGVLERGATVEVIGKVSEGWYQIRYDGDLAFVAQNYLIDEMSYQKQNEAAVLSANETADSDTKQQESVSDQNYAEIRNQVVTLMNAQRVENGIGELVQSDSLNNLAQIRVIEIAQNFSHTRPSGLSCFTVLTENGIAYQTAGENIAMGYVGADEVMNGWMNSEGHRANILNAAFGQVGVGVYAAEDGSGFYWVQIFTN